MRRSRLLWQFLFLAGVLASVIVFATLWQLLFTHAIPPDQRRWPVVASIAAAAVLLVAVAGLVQVRSLSSRIRRVLNGLQELGQGKYPLLLVEGKDELAEMTRRFNQMVEAVRTRDEKLKSWMGHRETEVLRLSQTLEEERKRLGTLLDAIGDGVIVLDSEGQVVMANGRVGEIFGVPMEVLTRTNLAKLIEQVRHRMVRPDLVEEKIRELMRNPGRVDEITLELDEPGGQAIRLYCAPVRGADGKVLGRVATWLDLGRERELDRLKTEFLSTISHELRTPLTSVKGSLGLIRGGAAGPISADMRELLDIAVTNTDRLIRVINDILDVFQLERGQARIRQVPISLGQSVAHAIQNLAELASLRKITVETQLAEGLPLVNADPKRVEQVLVNLISNAIKFSSPDQKVVVSAHAEDPMVVVSVQDFGRGMSAVFLERLFHKFEHEQGALIRESQGPGLGLAICKQVVAAHGGRIWAESEEGKGTTFRFSLPAVAAPRPELAETAEPIPAELSSPRLILVIDDDQDVARVISYVLESQGHRVITVHSGRDAIAMARRHRPDMITLDVNMPDMDGYSVLKTLRSDAETHGIPIVCISVEPDSSIALSQGADYYLEKPLDIDKLRETALRALATS